MALSSVLNLSLTVVGFLLFIAVSRSSAKYRFCDKTTHEEYDDSTHICCDGEVRRRVRDQGCCALKTTYFQSTHLCCGGQVVDRYLSYAGSKVTRQCTGNNGSCREQICCGNQVVDKLSTECCQGTPILLNETQVLERDSLQCCGVNVINRTTHFCCGVSAFPLNSLLNCCSNRVYRTSEHKCLDNYSPPRIVNISENFCGNAKYDMTKNSCCSEVLNDVPERDPMNPAALNVHRECCDSIVYNSTKNKCCRASGSPFRTHIIPGEATVHCCGNGWYNDTRQDCHKGIVLEKMPGMTRCGFEYVDGVNEKCCADSRSYNANDHDCCEGDSINIISKNQMCCNGEGFNDNQLCCNEVKVCDKRHPDDDECCYSSKISNGTTYNSKHNEHCVDEEVMVVPPDAKPCTRSNYYYPATQICCRGKVESMSSGYDECCDSKPYKSKTQQCCENEVSNIPSTEGSCCLQDSRVYKFGDTQNPCLDICGKTAYDAVTHVCCGGVVHVRRENTDCCGSSSIDSHTTGCCGGLFTYKKSGNMRCCADREPFDRRHSKCQNSKIVPRIFVEKKQPDVQTLCNNMALMHFDGAIRYACESVYVVQGRLVKVVINKEVSPEMIYIILSLADVRNVNRGKNFTSLTGQKNLNFTIEVPNTNGVTCRKRFLDRCCNVIVFFSAGVKNGHVTISKDSKFFMARYNRKRHSMITKQLTHEYCRDKFDLGEKKQLTPKQ